MMLISPETIGNVQRAFAECLAHCQTVNGGHFEHLLRSPRELNLSDTQDSQEVVLLERVSRVDGTIKSFQELVNLEQFGRV
ncbi:hypothetical protein NQ318_015687 [Aromia moschata]|uniref:Uncharacterized protein n=1 Tax=Aromia moschata TaxID=1265417 RepID=A0AAV8YGH5_9CUCU|nr:hypothetical protein NQ318_015687 [Aromia moschata]